MNYRQNLFILTGQNEIWPLFKHCNLMVRPTSIDGYGVSIAEAIHFDCPALASDVCERHHKAKLFKSRDNLDFYNKASSILFNKS
jgi:glycosyltransferase involved in cell wall biosynthesis